MKNPEENLKNAESLLVDWNKDSTHPEPNRLDIVISVGSCSISGGVFAGCYNVGGAVDEVIPVDVFIPGCPPRPEAIVDGIIQLLTHLKQGNPPPSQIKPVTEKALP